MGPETQEVIKNGTNQNFTEVISILKKKNPAINPILKNYHKATSGEPTQKSSGSNPKAGGGPPLDKV